MGTVVRARAAARGTLRAVEFVPRAGARAGWVGVGGCGERLVRPPVREARGQGVRGDAAEGRAWACGHLVGGWAWVIPGAGEGGRLRGAGGGFTRGCTQRAAERRRRRGAALTLGAALRAAAQRRCRSSRGRCAPAPTPAFPLRGANSLPPTPSPPSKQSGTAVLRVRSRARLHTPKRRRVHQSARLTTASCM